MAKLTFAATLVAAASVMAQNATTTLSPQASCSALFDACRVATNANMAQCAANSASCFGQLTAAPANGTTVTTEVVATLTTYCPDATALTVNNKTYTVTGPSTLTITDCPCTITHGVPVNGPKGTAGAVTGAPAPSVNPTANQPAAATQSIAVGGAGKVGSTIQAVMVALAAAVVA